MSELTMIKCSKETRQQLKVLAAKAGMTMQAYLEKLVRDGGRPEVPPILREPEPEKAP